MLEEAGDALEPLNYTSLLCHELLFDLCQLELWALALLEHVEVLEFKLVEALRQERWPLKLSRSDHYVISVTSFG